MRLFVSSPLSQLINSFDLSILAAAHGAVDEEAFIRQFEDVPKVNVSINPQ